VSSDALARVTPPDQYETGRQREPDSGPQTREVPRNRRQEETFRKVLAAGMETMREKSYGELTVRMVAARAKVAPATAYTYFSSKNHLIAEVYLGLVKQVPYFTDVNDPMPVRVESVLRHLALVVADEPEVAAACTTALLGGASDSAVRAARDRIGAEIHRRIASAIGPGGDPATVSALEMTFYGALVQAASGEFTYHGIAERMADTANLILNGAAGSGGEDAGGKSRQTGGVV
jgi:AcrR family transcriptional regulator